MSSTLLMLVLWATVPDNCDPVDFIYQPREIQEYLADAGYLVWMHNCLVQQEIRSKAND